MIGADRMKEIVKSIDGKCFKIELLKDLGDYALYLNKSDNQFSGFEVHKIRIKKVVTCKIKGKEFTKPDRRVIASSEEFGIYAWHYPTLEIVYQNYPQFKSYDDNIRIMLSEWITHKTFKKTIGSDINV
jgi:hypothetical protein